MLRARQKLGKYRIVRRLSEGPLASVYQAYDSVLDKKVALKVPTNDRQLIDDFIHEARVASRLEHPGILRIQDATTIDGVFVLSMALGTESLGSRIERRMSRELALNFTHQALAAVSYAHANRIIHCDIKPENFIVFPGNHLKLCDFGFAKISSRTIKASGSGTIDYISPEQALGRPRLQSDVFSLGLVLCRLLGGKLPEWPFEWPPEGIDRLKQWLQPATVGVLQTSIEVDPAYRYASVVEMERAFLRAQSRKSTRSKKRTVQSASKAPQRWQKLRQRECKQRYGKALALRESCRSCSGPVAESMQYCPWCSKSNPCKDQATRMPWRCPHCDRGVKSDWGWCPWCYGRRFEAETERRFSDKRYVGQCHKAGCHGPLMRFMRYCPWCHTKVQRKWTLPGTRAKCERCDWGIAKEFWENCAWCGHTVSAKQKRSTTRRLKV